MRLKISHIRGTTAVKVTEILNKILFDEFKKFYDEIFTSYKLGSKVILGNSRIDAPWFDNQSDVLHFLHGGRTWSGIVFSEDEPENYESKNYTRCLLNDTLTIEIKLQPIKYNIWANNNEITSFIAYDVNAKLHVIDRNLLLDSLNIEPDLNIPEYVDVVGNPIHVGDTVVYSNMGSSKLRVSKIKKFSPYSISLMDGSIIKNDKTYSTKLAIIQ